MKRRRAELARELVRLDAAIAAYTGKAAKTTTQKTRGKKWKAVGAVRVTAAVTRACKICGNSGHNSRTCPVKPIAAAVPSRDVPAKV